MHLICILHKNSPKGNFHYKETFSFSYLGYKLFTKIYLKMFREFSYLYQKFKSCLSLSTFANAEIYIWKEDLEKTWEERSANLSWPYFVWWLKFEVFDYKSFILFAFNIIFGWWKSWHSNINHFRLCLSVFKVHFKHCDFWHM